MLWLKLWNELFVKNGVHFVMVSVSLATKVKTTSVRAHFGHENKRSRSRKPSVAIIKNDNYQPDELDGVRIPYRKPPNLPHPLHVYKCTRRNTLAPYRIIRVHAVTLYITLLPLVSRSPQSYLWTSIGYHVATYHTKPWLNTLEVSRYLRQLWALVYTVSNRYKYRCLLWFLQDSKGYGLDTGVEVNSKFLSLFFLSFQGLRPGSEP